MMGDCLGIVFHFIGKRIRLMMMCLRIPLHNGILALICILIARISIANGEQDVGNEESFCYMTSTAMSVDALKHAVSKTFSIYVSTNAQYSIERVSDRRLYQIHPKTELYNNILSRIQSSTFLRNGETNELEVIPCANHLFFDVNLRSFQCREQFAWDWMYKRKASELDAFVKDINNLLESYNEKIQYDKRITIPKRKPLPVSTYCPEVIPGGKATGFYFYNNDVVPHNLIIAASPLEPVENVIVETHDGRKWRPCDLSSQCIEKIRPGLGVNVKILVLPDPKAPDGKQAIVPVLLKIE